MATLWRRLGFSFGFGCLGAGFRLASALTSAVLTGASFASANGKPISFNKSSACVSFGALVTIVMSMPCVRLILSSSISGKIVCSATPNV